MQWARVVDIARIRNTAKAYAEELTLEVASMQNGDRGIARILEKWGQMN